MIIIFYDTNDETIHVCSPSEKTKILSINDPDLLDHIPNDDILYVTNGHWMEKRHFAEWLNGTMQIEDNETVETNTDPINTAQPSTKPSQVKRYYIRATRNGTVRIEDIRTKNEPEGIELNGKWDFRAIDEIGQDVVDESNFLKILLAKGKVEIVNQDYVNQHKHKQKTIKSPAEKSLDSILIPASRRAADVAADGGIEPDDNIAVPIDIEG